VLLVGFALISAPLAAATRQPSTARTQTTKKPKKAVVTPARSSKASPTRRTRSRRAAAAAREAAALAVPRFKVDEQGSVVPDVRAEAAIIYDPETRQVVWQDHGQDQRSIASITKVMTAICFLESQPDLNRQVTVEYGDTRAASTTYLRAGERIYVNDLLYLLLIGSDNAAARVLARVSPGGTADFIQRMNEKAAQLELTSTSYADPSGLASENVSSAYDMARLISYAASDERISSIMRTAEYTFSTSRRTVTVHSTNQLVRRGDVEVLGGKTGFITKAGYCLATLLRLPGLDHQVAVVVLGARSNAARFMETRHLLNWIASRAPAMLGARTEAPQEQ
jgi:D-alanyl-D-alanine endopeptidase (penicillin-binding protein 7)